MYSNAMDMFFVKDKATSFFEFLQTKLFKYRRMPSGYISDQNKYISKLSKFY